MVFKYKYGDKIRIYLHLNEWGSISDDDSILYDNLPFRMYFRNRRSRKFDNIEQLERWMRQPVDESYPRYIEFEKGEN